MKTRPSLLLVAALFLCLSIPSSAGENSAVGPAIPLPPFHVNEFMSYFGFAWKAVLKDDKIERLRFSRVDRDSLASRCGLEIDDRLIAIDGKPITGMSVENLQQVFFRNVKPGSAVLWKFSIERGSIFPKQMDITLQLRSAAQDSASGTEPAPGGN